MAFIKYEITLDLNQSEDCVVVATSVANQGKTFSVTETKLYVPVLNLQTQDNAKLLEQLKSGFKRTSNWNKHQTKVSLERLNEYLDFLIVFKKKTDFLFYHLRMKHKEQVAINTIFRLEK